MLQERCVSSETHLQELAELISGRLTTGDLRDIKCNATLELRAQQLYDATIEGDEMRVLLGKLSNRTSCQISAIRTALHMLRGDLPTTPASSPEVASVIDDRELVLQS